MKTSKIIKSFEALPQDQNEWRKDPDQREPARRQTADNAKPQQAAPQEELPPVSPRQWGIND